MQAIQQKLVASLAPNNPISKLSDSGARGNISNLLQLAGMRGQLAAELGGKLVLPVISNFRVRLTVMEMFMSTHGARMRKPELALCTAASGTQPRRLVAVALHVIVRVLHCGLARGLVVRAIRVRNEKLAPL